MPVILFTGAKSARRSALDLFRGDRVGAFVDPCADQPHAPLRKQPTRPNRLLAGAQRKLMGVIGILVEIAAAHTWIAIAAGVAAAFWLLSRPQ